MNVRLMLGRFFAVDGFAINDFETLSVGDVTDITPGLTKNADCNWGATVFFSRIEVGGD